MSIDYKVLDDLFYIGKLGVDIIVTTYDNDYEGQLLAINVNSLTMEYFNFVKDELREVDIPYHNILTVSLSNNEEGIL